MHLVGKGGIQWLDNCITSVNWFIQDNYKFMYGTAHKSLSILTEPKLSANTESSWVCGQQTYIAVTFPQPASHIYTMEGGVTKEGSASSGMCKYGNTERSRYDKVIFFNHTHKQKYRST